MAEPQRPTPSSYFAAAPKAARQPVSHLVSIRLSEDLLQRLGEVGTDEGLSMSDTIRLVLERGLAAKRGNPRKERRT